MRSARVNRTSKSDVHVDVGPKPTSRYMYRLISALILKFSPS